MQMGDEGDDHKDSDVGGVPLRAKGFPRTAAATAAAAAAAMGAWSSPSAASDLSPSSPPVPLPSAVVLLFRDAAHTVSEDVFKHSILEHHPHILSLNATEPGLAWMDGASILHALHSSAGPSPSRLALRFQ